MSRELFSSMMMMMYSWTQEAIHH